MLGAHVDPEEIKGFLDEWGPSSRHYPDADVAANDRLLMQKELFMLIVSGGKTRGKQAPKKEG